MARTKKPALKDYTFTFTIRGEATVEKAASKEEAEEVLLEFFATLDLEDYDDALPRITECIFASPIDIEKDSLES